MPFETFFQIGLRSRSQGSNIELVWAITCTFMHGFQNNFAHKLPLRRRSAI